MTLRERDAAAAMVAKFTGKFAADDVGKLIPTSELSRRLRSGERVLLVDMRTEEEQRVSMIPGAVTQRTFEDELLPAFKGESEPPLVVPYCTVGYRSGLYCRELVKDHGVRNIRNGEGIIMWTFDGGRLVRPLPVGSSAAVVGRAPPLEPENPHSAGEVVASPQGSVYGNRVADTDLSSSVEVVQEVHVYGKPWDCAAPGYTTVYFSPTTGASKFVWSKLRSRQSRVVFLWAWALALFYFFFTPACGLMYDCGCRLSASKWGQVEKCNVYTAEQSHRCPWCSCSGLSCVFVSSDAKAFRGVLFLDLLPDGCFVTILTVVVLRSSWRCMDRRLAPGMKPSDWLPIAAKALLALLWFMSYCVALGGIFFAAHSDYPYFLGVERAPAAAAAAAGSWGLLDELGGVRRESGVFLNATYLHDHLSDWLVLDARSSYSAAGGVIPGAKLMPWEAFAQGGTWATGMQSVLRPAWELKEMFAAAGVNGSKPVAVYGSWDAGWGEEGRLYWTLEYLGSSPGQVACLEGGVEAWLLAGFALEPAPSNGPAPPSGGSMPVSVEVDRRATTELVQHFVSSGNAVLLDVRDPLEYQGSPSGDPYGAARSGHIPGAIHWPWRQHVFAASQAGSGAFKPLKTCGETLGSLPPEASSKEIVTYCTGGIRSGFVFMILRSCGVSRLRNYDGSWAAWAANAALPCEGLGPGCSPPPPGEEDASAEGGVALGGGSGFGAM